MFLQLCINSIEFCLSYKIYGTPVLETINVNKNFIY